MTDDEADPLLRPPRRWPPLSAAAAAGLLLFPSLLMTGVTLWFHRWMDLLVPIVCLAVVARPAWNLLRGNEAGVGGGFGVLVLAGLLVAMPLAWGVWIKIRSAGEAIILAMPVVWITLTGFLLWWPATRRWCGLLPPADPDDD